MYLLLVCTVCNINNLFGAFEILVVSFKDVVNLCYAFLKHFSKMMDKARNFQKVSELNFNHQPLKQKLYTVNIDHVFRAGIIVFLVYNHFREESYSTFIV